MIAASSSTNTLLQLNESLHEEVYGSEFEFPYSEKAKDKEYLLNLSAILNKEIVSDATIYKLDKLPNLELSNKRSELKEKQTSFQQRLEVDKQFIKSDLSILHDYMKQTQKEEEWRHKLTQRAKLIQAQPKPEIPKEVSKLPSSSESTPGIETPLKAISTPPTISVSPNLSPITTSPSVRRRGTATEAKAHLDNSLMIEKMKEQWKKEKEEAIKKAEENNWTNTVSSKKNIWIFIICVIILSYLKQLVW